MDRTNEHQAQVDTLQATIETFKKEHELEQERAREQVFLGSKSTNGKFLSKFQWTSFIDIHAL